jgi:hypothetical protein
VFLPEYLPLEVQVFIAGLVLCRWKPDIDHGTAAGEVG